MANDTSKATTPAKPGDQKNDTDNAAKDSWWDRVRPLLFVLGGFVFWFIFVLLARVVLKCAPLFECSVSDLRLPNPLTWPETIVLLATLILAIWASRRIVFPRED